MLEQTILTIQKHLLIVQTQCVIFTQILMITTQAEKEKF